MKAQLIFILALLLSAVSCSNDNSKVLQRLNEAPATVREIQGANNLFVIELANNTNGLYSEYIVPSSALSAEYKEDGLSVLISGDVTNNFVAIDGYVSEGKGNTVTLTGQYNALELTTINKNEGDVSFYLCQLGTNTDTLPIKGEAYLFNDSIPNFMKTEVMEKYEKSGYAAWIVYETINELVHGTDFMVMMSERGVYKIATLYLYTPADMGRYYICNYPDFAREWKVPEIGQKVYYEGKAIYLGGYASNPTRSGYDLGLTIFKKK